MSEFRCTGCPYHWREEEEDFPRCHFEGLGLAPCEQEEYDDYYNFDREWKGVII